MVCGGQFVYADAEGNLKTAEHERRCPRCDSFNGKDVKYCENCGMQVGKYCGYCKTYHFIEDKVCPKTSEPIKGREEPESSPFKPSKVLVMASIALLMFIGFLMHGASKNNGVPGPNGKKTPVVIGRAPHIDVVFVVDSTGSMGDEIEVVKQKIRDMIFTISNGQPKPIVRYGLVAYRDRGDLFVTKKFPLTDGQNDITANISGLSADAGGDTEESVNEALNTAINDMNWDNSSNTRKIIFLIGDAGPHKDYQEPYNHRSLALLAKDKGIKIFTIGCSGITESGEPEFREIAKLTGGQFDFLTYQQNYIRSDGTTVSVIRAGEKTYEVVGGEKDEWGKGYSTMLREKKAVELPVAAGVAPEGMKASAPMQNNLDRMLTRQVQMEAESMGVKY